MGIKKPDLGSAVHVSKLMLFLIKIISDSVWYHLFNCILGYKYCTGVCAIASENITVLHLQFQVRDYLHL